MSGTSVPVISRLLVPGRPMDTVSPVVPANCVVSDTVTWSHRTLPETAAWIVISWFAAAAVSAVELTVPDAHSTALCTGVPPLKTEACPANVPPEFICACPLDPPGVPPPPFPVPPPTVDHTFPLHRQLASALPPPEQAPPPLAAVKMYTDPCAGESGRAANV